MNWEALGGIIVLVAVVGFIYNTFFNGEDYDEK